MPSLSRASRSAPAASSAAATSLLPAAAARCSGVAPSWGGGAVERGGNGVWLCAWGPSGRRLSPAAGLCNTCWAQRGRRRPSAPAGARTLATALGHAPARSSRRTTSARLRIAARCSARWPRWGGSKSRVAPGAQGGRRRRKTAGSLAGCQGQPLHARREAKVASGPRNDFSPPPAGAPLAPAARSARSPASPRRGGRRTPASPLPPPPAPRPRPRAARSPRPEGGGAKGGAMGMARRGDAVGRGMDRATAAAPATRGQQSRTLRVPRGLAPLASSSCTIATWPMRAALVRGVAGQRTPWGGAGKGRGRNTRRAP
jgi:hypothetical protein